MRIGASVALALALAGVAPASANELYRLGDIVIERPWARATPVKVGGAYMTLRNRGGAADRLVKIASPIAAKVEVHETRIEGGMATMRPAGALELAPGTTLALEPGGLHMMLMGLERPLAEGERLKLVLTFERAGTIEIEARVEKAGAAAPR